MQSAYEPSNVDALAVAKMVNGSPDMDPKSKNPHEKDADIPPAPSQSSDTEMSTRTVTSTFFLPYVLEGQSPRM